MRPLPPSAEGSAAGMSAAALLASFMLAFGLLAVDLGTAGPESSSPNLDVGLATLLVAAGSVGFFGLAAARRQLSAMWPGLIFPVAFAAFHFGSLGFVARGWYEPRLFPIAWTLSAVSLLGWMVGHALGRGSAPFAERARLRLGADALSRRDLELLALLGAVAYLTGICLQLAIFAQIGFGKLISADYGDTKVLLSTTEGRWAYINALGQLLSLVGLVVHATANAFLERRLFRRPAMIAATALFLVVLVLLGDRSSISSYLFPLLLLRHYFIRPIDPTRAATLGLLMFMLFAGVKVYRGTKRTQDLVTAATSYDRWRMTTEEMGYSLDTVIRSIEVVPDRQPYFMGKTYTDALGRVVPDVALARGESSVVSSVWITDLTSRRTSARKGGLGFSIVAEGYINFGFLGAPLVLMLIGLVHGAAERWLASAWVPLGRMCIFVLAEIVLLQHIRNSVVVYLRGTIWMGLMLLGLLLVAQLIRTTRPHPTRAS